MIPKSLQHDPSRLAHSPESSSKALGNPGREAVLCPAARGGGSPGKSSVLPSADLATDARRAPVTELSVSVPQIIKATEEGQVEDLKEDFVSMQARGFLRLAHVIIDIAFTLTRLIPDSSTSECRAPLFCRQDLVEVSDIIKGIAEAWKQ